MDTTVVVGGDMSEPAQEYAGSSRANQVLNKSSRSATVRFLAGPSYSDFRIKQGPLGPLLSSTTHSESTASNMLYKFAGMIHYVAEL